MGHPDARLDVVTGKEEKRNERMKGGDDDPLAARGTTALAARMKDEWHCYHVSSLTAAAGIGHRPGSSLGGCFSYDFLRDKRTGYDRICNSP